jgi:hypothetical protein
MSRPSSVKYQPVSADQEEEGEPAQRRQLQDGGRRCS